jgi:ribosomal protein S18 acetylase RimI-like enzyme
MGCSFDVRRYRSADADDVWDVHEAAFRASPLPFDEAAAVDEDLFAIDEHYLDRGGEFLVGELGADDDSADDGGGSQIGRGIVAVGGFLPVDEGTIEIKRMRVHPEFQRRGYAGAVLDELEARARAAGFETAELETIELLRAARAFYESTGYEVIESWEDDATGVERYRYRKRL